MRGFGEHLVYPPNGEEEAPLQLPCQSQSLLSALGKRWGIHTLRTAHSFPGQLDRQGVLAPVQTDSTSLGPVLTLSMAPQ